MRRWEPRARDFRHAAVPSCMALSCIAAPGAIAPPRNSPASLQQSIVIAVPASTTTHALPICSYAAAMFRMRSTPVDSGEWVSTLIGRSISLPTQSRLSSVTVSTTLSSDSISSGFTAAPATLGLSRRRIFSHAWAIASFQLFALFMPNANDMLEFAGDKCPDRKPRITDVQRQQVDIHIGCFFQGDREFPFWIADFGFWICKERSHRHFQSKIRNPNSKIAAALSWRSDWRLPGRFLLLHRIFRKQLAFFADKDAAQLSGDGNVDEIIPPGHRRSARAAFCP